MGRGQRGSYVTGEEVSGIETPCVRGAVKAIESVLDYRYSEHGEGDLRIGDSGDDLQNFALCYFYLCGLAHPALAIQSNAPGFPNGGVLRHYRRFIQNLQAARFCLSVRPRTPARHRCLCQPLLFILRTCCKH